MDDGDVGWSKLFPSARKVTMGMLVGLEAQRLLVLHCTHLAMQLKKRVLLLLLGYRTYYVNLIW